MGTTHADLYAAVGVHSGLACGAANDLSSAFVAMRKGGGSIKDAGPTVPTIVFHGDRDTTVHPNNGDRILRQFATGESTATKVLRGRVPQGHGYTRTILTDAGGRVRALEHSRCEPRLVGRPPRRVLHGSARAGCHESNVAFLPRTFTPNLVTSHGKQAPIGPPVGACSR
jgi:hypothetical protein